MTTITIDNVEYNTDNLSQDTLQQLQMLQVTEQELARLNAQLAIAQTARIAYANALKASLPVSTEGLVFGEAAETDKKSSKGKK